MSKATFTLTIQHDMILRTVNEMTGVRAVLNGYVLTAYTVPPFAAVGTPGGRMQRVENVVRGIDPDAVREDVEL